MNIDGREFRVASSSDSDAGGFGYSVVLSLIAAVLFSGGGDGCRVAGQIEP